MKLAVTDSNIFIDLFYLKSVSFLFEIGYEIITTDDIIEEIRDQHAAELTRFIHSGLLTVETVRKEDREVLLKMREYKRLSEYDLTVLWVAEKNEAMVLSGDTLIRKSCQTKNIEVHGILWCLNQFTEYHLIEKSKACDLLHRLMKFNKRLPEKNCKDYIENKWGGKFNME